VDACTGCANKKQSTRNNFVVLSWEYGFEPEFQTLYVIIRTTYPTNFIAIWYNRYSSLNFKVHILK